MNGNTCTPGPWTAKPTGTPTYARQYAIYSEADGRTIALVYDGEHAAGNARLLAAAPELASALRDLAERAERYPLEDGSNLDTLEARVLLARIEAGEDEEGQP